MSAVVLVAERVAARRRHHLVAVAEAAKASVIEQLITETDGDVIVRYLFAELRRQLPDQAAC